MSGCHTILCFLFICFQLLIERYYLIAKMNILGFLDFFSVTVLNILEEEILLSQLIIFLS